MTEYELVAHKASRIRGRLDRIRLGLGVGREAFLTNLSLTEQVAFNVFLAMQESLDLASHIVAEEGWGTPATLAETFDLLARNQVVSVETAENMRRGTRLRNLIAHAYADIDAEKLFDSARAGLGQIERFLAEVGTWLTTRAESPSA